MSILINLATEFTGKKAFKEADKAIDKLTKGSKKLAAAFGIGLSTAAVVAFGKASVKAFTEAEKANTRLANVIDNLGLSFATADIQKNLDEISAKAGIAGELLVDAFQPLLTATGSVIKSQEMLKQALDISAGAGVDLVTASQDLAQAYVGNTKGLKKYNLGLTKAELSTLSYAKASELLNKQFSGSSAKYLDTYAGKMQVLGEAAGNAQEVIGGGLVDALMTLGGSTTVEDLATDMSDLATYTANVIRGIGNLGKELEKSPTWLNDLSKFLAFGIGGIGIGKGLDALAKSGGTKQSTGFSFFGSPMEAIQKKRDAAAAAKAEKDAAKRAKAIVDSQKKNTAELKKQNLAKKQSALFDLNQIQIIAALKGKISDEEKLRLELQLALLQGNDVEADKLSQKLANTIDQTGNLAKYLTTLPDANNPFKSWDSFLDAMIAKARAAAAAVGSVGAGGGSAPSTNVPSSNVPPSLPNTEYNQGTYVPSSGYVAPTNIVVEIDGKAIASALLDQSMSAGQVAYLDRRTGGF